MMKRPERGGYANEYYSADGMDAYLDHLESEKKELERKHVYELEACHSLGSEEIKKLERKLEIATKALDRISMYFDTLDDLHECENSAILDRRIDIAKEALAAINGKDNKNE